MIDLNIQRHHISVWGCKSILVSEDINQAGQDLDVIFWKEENLPVGPYIMKFNRCAFYETSELFHMFYVTNSVEPLFYRGRRRGLSKSWDAAPILHPSSSCIISFKLLYDMNTSEIFLYIDASKLYLWVPSYKVPSSFPVVILCLFGMMTLQGFSPMSASLLSFFES